MTIISRSAKIIAKLTNEGKVEKLDKLEYLNAIDEMNKELEIMQRESIRKAAKSWAAAKYIILDLLKPK